MIKYVSCNSKHKNIYSGVILLALLMLVCLSGCSNQPAEEQGTLESSAAGAVETPEQSAQPEEFTTSPEIISAPVYSNTIQIGNTVITEPPQYSDFIDAGAQFVTEGMTEDFLLNPDETESVDMQIGSTTFRLSMKNTNSELCSLKDAEVTAISSTKGPEVFYPMGIKVGDSLSDLTDKWGQPSVDNSKSTGDVLTYLYLDYPVATSRVHSAGVSSGMANTISATGFKYTVSIDRNTAQITDIQCVWIDKTQPDKIVDVSEEIPFMSGDTCTLSYKMPYELSQNIITVGGKAVSVYIIDNTPYIVVFDASLSNMGFDKSASEAELTEAINSKYASVQYEIESIQTDGTEGRAVGYLYSDSMVECKIAYINESFQCTSSESRIIPVDENGTVSEAAAAKFKEIMADFAASIQVTPRQ